MNTILKRLLNITSFNDFSLINIILLQRLLSLSVILETKNEREYKVRLSNRRWKIERRYNLIDEYPNLPNLFSKIERIRELKQCNLPTTIVRHNNRVSFYSRRCRFYLDKITKSHYQGVTEDNSVIHLFKIDNEVIRAIVNDMKCIVYDGYYLIVRYHDTINEVGYITPNMRMIFNDLNVS